VRTCSIIARVGGRSTGEFGWLPIDGRCRLARGDDDSCGDTGDRRGEGIEPDARLVVR
jgi:hypothetical protein